LSDALILLRAVHFIATLSVAGVVIFLVFVGEPAFGVAGAQAMAAAIRRRLASIAWLGLALAVLTGAAWLVVLAAQMSERPLGAMWSEDFVWTVLSDTDFGHVWLVRLALIVPLAAASLVWSTGKPAPPQLRLVALVSAAAFVGIMAFTGHAAAGSGGEGIVEQVADMLHLVAAAAWVGALAPLAVLLGAAANDRSESSLRVARAATLRFSILGIASVATILVSGVVNTWELAGSVPALTGTDYGRLLLVKIALFLLMLGIAAVNRLRLTPRLVQDRDIAARDDALRQLRANSLVEAALGAAILAIVAALGTLPPGNEQTGHDAAFRGAELQFGKS
jgi:putative copper resistance protein D